MTDLCHGLNTWTCFADTETVPCQNLLVTLGVQLCKSGAELKLLTVDTQRTEGAFLTLHRISRKTLCVDTQKITHTRFLQLQESCHTVKTHYMHNVFLHRTKYPLQHIVEMHTDIRCDTAGLMYIALPGRVIPFTATRDIGQVHIVDLIFRPLLHFLFQRADLIVQTQLQNRIGLMTRLCF